MFENSNNKSEILKIIDVMNALCDYSKPEEIFVSCFVSEKDALYSTWSGRLSRLSEFSRRCFRSYALFLSTNIKYFAKDLHKSK